MLFAVTDRLGVDHIRNQIKQQILDEVNYLEYEYQEQGLTELIEETEERIEIIEGYNRFFYTIQNDQNRTLFDPYPTTDGVSGWRLVELKDYTSTQNDGLYYYRHLSDNIVLGVGRDLEEVNSFRSALRNAVLWVVVSALFMGGAFGFVFGISFSKKLKHIISVNESIERGDLAARINIYRGTDEFDYLSESLNRTFSRIQDLLNNLQTVSSGLAHDLKTPLSVIRNTTEKLEERLGSLPELHTVDRQIQMMSSHIDSILLIAELESGNLRKEFHAVDLSALTEDLLATYADIFSEADIQLSSSVEPNICIQGMTELLQRLLVNLLDNVFQHGDGTTKVSLQKAAEKSYVVLSVENELRAASQTNRVDKLTKNHNVGLKIAKAIVHLHFGTWSVSCEDGVFSVRIILPL